MMHCSLYTEMHVPYDTQRVRWHPIVAGNRPHTPLLQVPLAHDSCSPSRAYILLHLVPSLRQHVGAHKIKLQGNDMQQL